MDAALLVRIAEALERLAQLQQGRHGAPSDNAHAPTSAPRLQPDWSAGWAFVVEGGAVVGAPSQKTTPLSLLVGMEAQKAVLLENTRQFAAGRLANNALLWGARGTGKSALVKSICAEVGAEQGLKLLQVSPENVTTAPDLLNGLRHSGQRIILFLDDLSLDADSQVLRALKPALDGGLSAAGGAFLVYATSNRRHLLARDPAENNPDDLFWRDTAEERLALSDRFGLALGFHSWDQDTYLSAVRGYGDHFGLAGDDLEAEAIRWALTRGARSGRTAWHFIIDRAGRAGVDLAAR